MSSRSVAAAILTIVVLAWAPTSAGAGESQGLPFEVGACAFTSQAPEIDGSLDDACWSQALPLAPFQKLTRGTPAEHQSTGYLLWDRSRLYIGVQCQEPEMERIRATVTQRDGPVYSDDCIEIFLVPPHAPLLARFPEHRRYFHLIANSMGTRYDEIGLEAPRTFDGQWRAAAARGESAWSLEVAVPFADFGVTVSDGDVWRGNISRARWVEKEYSTWAPLQRTFHDRQHFGQIVFTRDVRATARRIDELEFAALNNGLLVPRMRSLAELIRRIGDEALELPEDPRSAMLREVGRIAGRLRNLQFGLRRLGPDNFRDEWRTFDGRLTRLERDTRDLRDEVAMLAATGGGREPWEVFITEAITNRRLLSNRWPEGVPTRRRIELTACPGEYESATFLVYAIRELEDVTLSISELRSGDQRLEPSCIDPYVVKCWYQAGHGIGDLGRRLLTPELLLKDDSLVRVDHEEQRNYVRAQPGSERYLDVSRSDSSNLADLQPRDADELLPVDIPARSLKQFWLTAHIPEDAAAGNYAGTVSISAAGGLSEELPIRIRVLPFALSEPALEYSIYYRGKLSEDGQGSITSERKSPEQFAAEMRDMVAHGVVNPTIYQSFDERLLDQVFDLREAAGMRGKPVMTLGVSTGAPQTEEALAQLKERVQRWLDFVRARGYEELYVYGIDEASGERLRAERAAFQAVHEVGAKVFVACYRGYFDVVGDLLDMPVWSGQPDPEEAEKAHSVGHRIFNYGNPQCGVEEPETYRRNFGLLLWKANYDGAMDYAYQHSFTHIWNDFDNSSYRDHTMAYPTVNGIIDTVEWEGFREAVDDVRYLTTLIEAVEEAESAGGARARRARQIAEWIDTIDPQGDLDAIRRQIIHRILELQAEE
ncbi:MAG: sugar-binding protein [Armatimonadota bacterium]|nr:sugar-binding protein [Armatimonadota bacterium]